MFNYHTQQHHSLMNLWCEERIVGVLSSKLSSLSVLFSSSLKTIVNWNNFRSSTYILAEGKKDYVRHLIVETGFQILSFPYCYSQWWCNSELIHFVNSGKIGTHFPLPTPVKNSGPLWSLHSKLIAFGRQGPTSSLLILNQ